MPFLPSSRYAEIATVEVPGPGGRPVTVVKLRRLAVPDGDPVLLAAHDRLDVMAHDRYGESTEFWHIADANTELDATELVEPGRVIKVPSR
jgi:hypothetical protein